MNELVSPKYIMQLVNSVEDAIIKEYKNIKLRKIYLEKWHKTNGELPVFNDNYWENFKISFDENHEIDLLQTLHNMNGEDLLKIAIDLGVDTPDFIPSIPTFKNELKANYKTAYDTFTKAFKQIETDPSLAIGLANSALESIIKVILKDDRINLNLKGKETLFELTKLIVKKFNLNDNHPTEMKTIGSSLISINQAIEGVRSNKTNFHGKTDGDYTINDSIYAYFIINTVTTVGLFLQSYYTTMYPKSIVVDVTDDELPF